jgi:T5SS/PEP-CTERM-associated repeat protein
MDKQTFLNAWRQVPLSLMVFVSVVWFSANDVQAADQQWDPDLPGCSLDAYFENPNCWAAGFLPDESDVAIFDSPETYTARWGVATLGDWQAATGSAESIVTNLGLRVQQGNLSLLSDSATAYTYLVKSGNVDINSGGSLTVGGIGTPMVLQSANATYVDTGGELNVVGAGSRLYGKRVGSSAKTALYLGSSGSGTLSVRDGGNTLNNTVYIGYGVNGTGLATIDGVGSSLSYTSGLYVGYEGVGTLEVLNGATLDAIFPFTNAIGYMAGSEGTLRLSGTGSSWTTVVGTEIGRFGSGTLEIMDGAHADMAIVSAGEGAGSEGTILVDGTNSLLEAWQIRVGRSGTGQMTIRNGGAVVSDGAATVGIEAGSSGAVIVEGANSSLLSSSIVVGSEGNGTLDILAGGFVGRGLGDIGLEAGSAGAVSVSGTDSTWELGSEYTECDHSCVTYQSYSRLRVGVRGAGTMEISDGGYVRSGDGIIGVDAGSSGVVTIDGAASRWVAKSDLNDLSSGLVVGREGDGELNIRNGASVETGSLVVGSTGAINLEQGSVTANLDFYSEGAVTNEGVVTAVSGANEVIGDVINTTSGQIVIMGGSTITFHDDVLHNGAAFNVSSGSSAVINGAYSGAGAITGLGTTFFNGGFQPGNSPGLVAVEGSSVFGDTNIATMEIAGLLRGTEYDAMDVGNELVLNGVLELLLIDGYVAIQGNSFDLFKAGVISGAFQTQTLPELEGELFWKVVKVRGVDGSNILRAQVVPVPAAVWLFGSALAGLGWMRRKQPSNLKPNSDFQ